MRKYLIIGLVVLVAVMGLVALAGCGGDDETTTTAPADTGSTEPAEGDLQPLDPPVTVKVAYDNAPGTAGIILADKMGFFEQQGITIEYVEFASGAQMYTSLAAGQVDVGRGIITASLFNGAAQDVPVWVVADSGTNVAGKGSYFTVVIRKDLENEIKDYADLKGRKVGIVSVGSINEYFLRKALEKGGLTIEDVEPTIINEFPDLNVGLANKALDAAVQIEPLITSGEEAGILTYFKDAEEYAPGEQVAVLLYSDAFAKNTEVANRFMLAHLQGVRAYNDGIVQGDVDRDNVISILTQNTFIDDPAVWPKMRPTGLDADGKVLEDAVAGQQDYYAEIGQVDEKVTMDKVIDMSFADWAVQQLGPYAPPQ
ncbi:MAG: ABC transporter substrate-binding protein [Thermoleophilia bacterium]|nr:ABC transporter substrate-binding protein [Thermoleophilia bacterium]